MYIITDKEPYMEGCKAIDGKNLFPTIGTLDHIGDHTEEFSLKSLNSFGRSMLLLKIRDSQNITFIIFSQATCLTA